jgi:undecaprenyl diphosphate synthase
MIDRAQLADAGTEEERLLQRIDLDRLPNHVAVIMDGNGRWARERHLPRVAGHRAGIEAVRETVEVAARLGLRVLTLYAFSQENWKRPHAEVTTLMGLLRDYVAKERHTLVENDIKLRVIGRFAELPAAAQRELQIALDETRENKGLQFNLALSYGGRTEIVDACRSIVESGVPADRIDAALFADKLYTTGQPDPDLLIRTSGELRISNFLLWQIAYSEIWVTQTLWPDFRRRHLFQSLLDYQGRERRYGGLGPRGKSDPAAVGKS